MDRRRDGDLVSIEGVFEAALLRYIQANVDQMAESIIGYEQEHSCCLGHGEDDSCCCDTGMFVAVSYRVPREADRFGRKEWEYRGNFFDLINRLDAADKEAGL